MEYNENEMAKLISEVETEFKDYLTKAENTESGEAEVPAEEIVLEKNEDFDYDEADISTLRITNTASAGSSATIDYNETPNTILVGHPPPPPVSESTFFKLVGAVSHSQNLYGAYDIDVINDFAYVPAISSNRLSVVSR